MSVTKVSVKTKQTSHVVEHWVAETQQELVDAFQTVERNYPTNGYGTMLQNIRQDPTGKLWHAEFSRYNSCD